MNDALCICGHRASHHDTPDSGDTRCLAVEAREDLLSALQDGRDGAYGYCACLRLTLAQQSRGLRWRPSATGPSEAELDAIKRRAWVKRGREELPHERRIGRALTAARSSVSAAAARSASRVSRARSPWRPLT